MQRHAIQMIRVLLKKSAKLSHVKNIRQLPSSADYITIPNRSFETMLEPT